MIRIYLAALSFLAGCAHVPPCGTGIATVGSRCADPLFALCDLNFANPVPPQGCWLPVDPHGPSESVVICVRSCAGTP